MGELSVKEKMEHYVIKCQLLGIHNFDFEYWEESDRVSITHIYAKENEKIEIPPFVSWVESEAWYDNTDMNICKLIIPKGCSIDFGNCEMSDCLANHVSEIIVKDNHEKYLSKDGVLFSKDMTKLLVYPRYKEETNYTVPSKVITISAGAFCYNRNLENLNLSKNIIEIKDCDFCNTTKINVKKENTSYKSIKGCLYSYDGRVLYHIYIPDNGYIKIEEGTVLVKDILFDEWIDELYIPSTIKEITNLLEILKCNSFDIIKAPRRLKKYLKEYEEFYEIIYY